MASWRTRRAKAWWFGVGQLSRVKLYQKFYWLDLTDDPENPFVSTPAGRQWSTSGRVLEWMYRAERIDPEHFDHWAYDHSECGGESCKCGGVTCDRHTWRLGLDEEEED